MVRQQSCYSGHGPQSYTLKKERETEISIKVRVNPFIYSHSFGRSPPYINNVRYYCRKL